MPLEKAILTNTVTRQFVQLMFNPEEYSLSKDINYAQIGVPGLSAPILQFVHGNMQTLEMELLLDTLEEHREGSRVVNQAGEDVRNHLRKITDFMEIDSTTHAPPVLVFTWASLTFTCVLARVTSRFILFLPSGTPVRVRIQATFNEYRNSDLEAKEVKRETADYSKMYVVTQGETLSTIAARTYGNPLLWRPVALYNDLDDPSALTPGMRLVIPRLPFRDPDTGEIYE